MDYAAFLYATHGRPNSGPNCRTRTGLFWLEGRSERVERETRTHVLVMIASGNSNVKKTVHACDRQSILFTGQGEMGASARPIVEYLWWYTRLCRAINLQHCTVQGTLRYQISIHNSRTSRHLPAFLRRRSCGKVGIYDYYSYFHRPTRETRQSILTFIAQRGSISETLCFSFLRPQRERPRESQKTVTMHKNTTHAYTPCIKCTVTSVPSRAACSWITNSQY